MRKHWLLLVQVCLSIFLLFRIFSDSELRAEAAQLAATADMTWLLAGLATALTSELLCTLRWWILLRVFGVPVPFLRTCAFSGAGLFFSLGLPGSGGGDAFRIIYVMRLHPAHKLRALLSVVADRLCGMAALIVFLVLPLLRRAEFTADPRATTIFGIALSVLLAAVLLVILWWLTTLPRLHARWLPYVPVRIRPQATRLGHIFSWIATHPRPVAGACLVSLAATAAHFCTYWFSSQAFGLPLSLTDMFTVMPLIDTLTMLPVTLYGIGLRETLFEQLLGALFGIPAGAATMTSLGGFSLQAAVALLGGLLVPFTSPRRPPCGG